MVLVGEQRTRGWGGFDAHLGGDDEVVSLPAVLFNGLAHDLFALAAGIHLGAVEKVDAAVVCSLHAGIGTLCAAVSMRDKLDASGEGIIAYRGQRGHRM